MTRLLLPLVLALLAGCASAPPLADRPAPAGMPYPKHVLDTLARDLEGFKTLRANVEGDAPQGSFSGVIFVDRERRAFHLVTWKLAGAIPIFDMLVADGTLRLLVPRAGKVLVRRLDAPPAAGERVPLEAVARSVLGSEGTTRMLMSALEVNEVRGATLTATYRLLPGSLAVASQEILEPRSSSPAIVVRYSDHEALANGRYAPRALEVSRPGEAEDRALTLRFSDLVWDVPIEAKKFEQRTPPDTVEVKTLAELQLE